MGKNVKLDDPETIRERVRSGYAKVALGTSGSCCGAASSSSGSGCCGAAAPEQLARDLGYDEAELAVLPEGSNMGLSCGNPAAIAALKPGETVLDLGSGGGFDVFVAGRRVGEKGRAIGIDMTPEMLGKARKNIISYTKNTGFANVEFRLGEIEHLPVADASVDVVISNCVLNLSPDKPQVWRDIARVLRPGGRAAISDIALVQPLPESLVHSIAALVGCVAGAVEIRETERLIREAGLETVEIVRKPEAIAAMTDGNDPLFREVLAALPAGSTLTDYVTSVAITARKPV
ncbi:MAG TPA: arsenite methyltransferase [Candidatus Ozemobacteraceae bacterium]|nr:arsenite methyltransferase [Candidatus Ozemobacteraceae bacterium]